MSSTTTLKLGHHIWFVVHHTGSTITGLEEHDFREGGGLLLHPGSTWEQMFLSHVEARCAEGKASPFYEQAVQLLVSIADQESVGE
jgi:hypothetical protein